MYRVLVVDDEWTEREGLAFLIKQQELCFEIDKACNGQEAFELLQRWPADVLITDIQMPLMNGLELSERIKELYPQMIILISSAYDEFEYMHRAIKVKVEDYILKPVDINQFVPIISRVRSKLDERSRERENRRKLFEDYNGASFFIKEKLMLQLLDDIPPSQPFNDSDTGKSEKKAISQAVALIESHYCEEIGLEWVAGRIYLSPGYLSGLFKKETGKSIIQYITLCRMENAKKLLLETNMKIVDVCQKVGYNNPSYFTLIFRKYFGVTPNHMREKGERA